MNRSKKMKEYVALVEGCGEGCDYTIGCNQTWEFLEAEDMEDAKRSLLSDNVEYECDEDEDDDDGCCFGDEDNIIYRYSLENCPPERITIIEIANSEDLDIDGFIKEKKKQKKNKLSEEKKSKELKLLEELKKKYENI